GPVKLAICPARAPFDSMRSGQVRSGVQVVLTDSTSDNSAGTELIPGVFRIASADIQTYHTIRGLALQGARLVLAPGIDESDVPLLRTRAAENRIFVGAASSGRAWLISPDGRVRASSRHNDEPVVESIDLNKADDKHVTPETDIFKQRRPELYQFNP